MNMNNDILYFIPLALPTISTAENKSTIRPILGTEKMTTLSLSKANSTYGRLECGPTGIEKLLSKTMMIAGPIGLVILVLCGRILYEKKCQSVDKNSKTVFD